MLYILLEEIDKLIDCIACMYSGYLPKKEKREGKLESPQGH